MFLSQLNNISYRYHYLNQQSQRDQLEELKRDQFGKGKINRFFFFNLVLKKTININIYLLMILSQ
ncbi:hypothetical protein BDA99DRAFT_510272 [Phascolomyces articulosus]|uniref:Uncharacterized protein n=1 Tax=Phascolomyces articulosus TaxID=60185 RepID=A0AAD5PDG5_9FUNG|nr:hypothetical protein BDA99DRAFT_510272 [Phascolomyces articulosus]